MASRFPGRERIPFGTDFFAFMAPKRKAGWRLFVPSLTLPAMRWIAPLLSLALLVSCTRPADVPELPGNRPTSVAKLVFGDRLGPADVKRLFRALNEDGDFDGLKSLFESPSDEEMERLARVLSRHVYERALDAEGFPSLLEARVRKGDFTRFAETAKRWAGRRHFAEAADATIHALADDMAPAIARRSVAWLDPAIARSVERLRAEDRFEVSREWEERPEVTPHEILSDLQLFLEGDVGERRLKQLEALGRAVETASLGEGLLRALRVSRARHRGPKGIEGLAYGFRRMLSSRPPREDAPRANQLDNLAYFAFAANRSTDGFFGSLEKRIDRDPGQAQFLSQLFRKLVAEAIDRQLARKLSTPDFWKAALPEAGKPLSDAARRYLYRTVADTFASIRGPHKKKNEEGFDPFPANLRTELNAFALTLWLEKLIEKNEAALRSAAGKSAESVLATSVETEALPLDWKTNDRPPQFPHEAGMRLRNFPADTMSDLHAYLCEGLATHYPYRFDARRGELARLLRDAIDECDRVLPLGDELPAVITSLAVLASRPKEGVIATLDTTNLMDSLQRLLAAVDVTTMRKVESLLFKKLALDTIEWNGIQGIEEKLAPLFAEHKELLEALGAMIRSLHAVRAADTPPGADLPTPLEAYHLWLQSLRPASGAERLEGVGALTEWLAFLSKENAFRFRRGMIGMEKATLEYSALPGIFDQAKGLAVAMDWLSRLEADPASPEDPDEATAWLAAARSSFGYFRGLPEAERSGLTLHLRFAHRLLGARPQGFRAFLDWVWEAGGEAWPDLETLSVGERRWITALVKTSDFASVRDVLRRHFDRAKALELVRELRRLEERRAVTQAFRLLSHARNERLRRIANAGLAMSDTGQLVPLLEGLETLLAAAQAVPAQGPLERASREIPLVAP